MILTNKVLDAIVGFDDKVVTTIEEARAQKETLKSHEYIELAQSEYDRLRDARKALLGELRVEVDAKLSETERHTENERVSAADFDRAMRLVEYATTGQDCVDIVAEFRDPHIRKIVRSKSLSLPAAEKKLVADYFIGVDAAIDVREADSALRKMEYGSLSFNLSDFE